MAYDANHDIYVPCYYVLMTSKSERCYQEAFKCILADLDHQMDPAVVGVDFEPAFIKTARIFFPKALIIGCFFHFKQALRRKLQKLGFPDQAIDHMMRWGVLDVITALPKADVQTIHSKGLLFVDSIIVTAEGGQPVPLDGGGEVDLNTWFNSIRGQDLMEKFWKYFSK